LAQVALMNLLFC